MESQAIHQILKALEEGHIDANQAFNQLKIAPFEDLGYAKIDHHRSLRQGSKEVIFGSHKTVEQISGILTAMINHGSTNILITRLDPQAAAILKEKYTLFYDDSSRIGIVNKETFASPIGNIIIATGGTSDIPVADEAALTAQSLGSHVTKLYDVGVAGVHRLLSNIELLSTGNVIIAVAGMEGALASVVGGLVDVPVIAVPTSVGYGASFNGIAALLSMLNSCSSGVSVVNIDNGFGAGYLAHMINKIGGPNEHIIH